MTDAGAARAASGSRIAAAGAAAAFFAGGDRRIHLEQLRHPANWSRRLVLVTGPRGVGKSALYRQLSASLDPRVKAARLNGALISTARDLLGAVIQGFALAAPADPSERLQAEVIANHADEQEQAGRCCLVLIDDADLLDARALDVLVTLAGAAPLRLVLFGEVRLVPPVQRAAEAAELGWHEIRLTGFGVGDVRAYLDWRYREQGHDGPAPFNDAEVKEIARLSEGLPGRIDQMANVLLAKIRAGGRGRAGGFPARHLALLAGLAAVLMLAWLLWPAGDDRPGRSRIEPLEVPPMAARTPAADTAAGELAPVPDDGAASAGGDGPAPVAPVEALGTEDPPVAESAPGGGQDGGQESPAGRDQAAPPPAAQNTAVADTMARQADPAPAAPAASGPHDAAWVMSRPSGAHTLQLGSFSTAERVRAYLARQASLEPFATFRQQRDGRTLHVVIHGEYPTRAAAEAAAAQLPASVGNVQPWIRSFGEVQAAVRTALQQ